MDSTRSVPRQRNCTQMEIVSCLIPDTKEGKSSLEFRRINDASRQKTRDNALHYFHRSAFPAAVCSDDREIVAEKHDVALALKRIGESSYMNPRLIRHLRSTAVTTVSRLHHDKKEPLLCARVEAALPEVGNARSAEDQRYIQEAKSVPYDGYTSEVLGPLNSLYRTDYCPRSSSARTNLCVAGVLLPRSKMEVPPTPGGAPAVPNRPISRTAISDDPSAPHAVRELSKKGFVQLLQHSAEMDGVKTAMDVHARRIASESQRTAALQREHERIDRQLRRHLVAATPSETPVPAPPQADNSVTRPTFSAPTDERRPSRDSVGGASKFISLPRSYFQNRAHYKR